MKKYLYALFTIFLIVSCSDIIEVPDISENTVTLVAPSNNSTLAITTITLSWNPVADAERYQVQVARPDFENILQLEKDSIVSENSISVQLEAGNSYQWRVRAINSEYVTSYATYSFTIE
ncbi:fibronectin type III domain-containing protein [Kordia algicida OT-1]|uniref:Fibronectin type-III domain-containing protein n=1 Tax=Kordia algicida OT-1 TaxID=391587 RepID=A9E976_9FLAO|nr:fibronectin type III domain-containing protein [Kordia algicida]EDP94646.1 hypothetical protein KAOT1_00180 [Kordia algicida OT-1]